MSIPPDTTTHSMNSYPLAGVGLSVTSVSSVPKSVLADTCPFVTSLFPVIVKYNIFE